MSENDIRMDADKWECELMAEDLARLQEERDNAVAAEAKKDKIIRKLEDQIQGLKASCNKAVARVKYQKYKRLRLPCLLLAVFFLAGLLIAAGTEHQLISNIIGEPLIAAMIAGCAGCAGIVYERARK